MMAYWIEARRWCHRLTTTQTSTRWLPGRCWPPTRSTHFAICQVDTRTSCCAADPALAKSDPVKYQGQYEVAAMVLGEDAADLGKSAEG